MEAISKQYIHKDNALEVTMQSIRSVLTPETADSEYTIRTKINELQKERKNLIAKALAENDDGKYDFQFTRIKQELEGLQAQLEGVQAVQKAQAVDEVRKHKKVAQKGRRKPKVCRTRGRAFQENRLQFEKLHFFFAKPRFSALKYGKCVKKCVTGKKKNRLNPVFKRLFVVGANGLEPLTPCTSSRCSSQLS